MTGAIVWFTGLPGAGKSTLAKAIAGVAGGVRTVEILDSDQVRPRLSTDLGFSRADRDTNVRRIGFVARLLARHGVFVVVAAISPYAETRREMRLLADQDQIPFIEAFVDASLDALIKRDVRGLYRRALAGEINHFTGVSDPYERPRYAELVLKSDIESVEESVEKILATLVARGHLPQSLMA